MEDPMKIRITNGGSTFFGNLHESWSTGTGMDRWDRWATALLVDLLVDHFSNPLPAKSKHLNETMVFCREFPHSIGTIFKGCLIWMGDGIIWWNSWVISPKWWLHPIFWCQDTIPRWRCPRWRCSEASVMGSADGYRYKGSPDIDW